MAKGAFASKYPGVCRLHGGDAWRARLYVRRRAVHLGFFASEEAAGRAVNAARLERDAGARDDFPGGVFRAPVSRAAADKAAGCPARRIRVHRGKFQVTHAGDGRLHARIEDAIAARDALEREAEAARAASAGAVAARDGGGGGSGGGGH
jgi:hypothetical protein